MDRAALEVALWLSREPDWRGDRTRPGRQVGFGCLVLFAE